MTRTKLMVLAVAAAAVAALAVFGLDTPGTKPQMRDVTLQLDWSHGAHFAGIYQAIEGGDFAAEGLRAILLEGSAGMRPAHVVAEGGAEFGIATAHHIIEERSQGNKVRALACFLQRSPFAFAVLASTGISHPRDFAGRTIRLAAQNEPLLDSILVRFGGEAGQYDIVHRAAPEEFLSGRIDIWGGYVTGQIRRFRESGADIVAIHPDDFGFHSYHQCLFATDELVAGQPDLAARLLRALQHGWRKAIDQPDTAVAATMRFEPDGDKEDMAAEIRAMRGLLHSSATAAGGIGGMDPEIWREMTETLANWKRLADPVDSANAHTLDILHAANEGG